MNITGQEIGQNEEVENVYKMASVIENIADNLLSRRRMDITGKYIGHH